MIPFILGLIIGILFGFIVCAVLSASRREEEILERSLPKAEEISEQSLPKAEEHSNR